MALPLAACVFAQACSGGDSPSPGGGMPSGGSGTSSGGSGSGDGGCAQPLPIEGHPDGPRSDEIYLECTPDYLNASGILVDPQDDMGNVRQRIAVFSDLDCNGPVFEVDDDVINDRYEDFSIVLERELEPELHAAICDSGLEFWPVEVTFADEADHVTAGRVLARVVVLYTAEGQ